MAEWTLGTAAGVTDKRVGRGGTGVDVMAEVNNTTSVSALRTRLAALDAAYFTTARLNTMTQNDLLYALRVRSADSAGI